MSTLRERTALVTGAARGIGLAIAERLVGGDGSTSVTSRACSSWVGPR